MSASSAALNAAPADVPPSQGSGDESVHAWNTAPLVDYYVSVDRGLWPDEFHALGASWPLIAGRPVLDIGFGTGRTTSYLRHVASPYVGVDISAGMLAAARRRFPGLDLRQGDARALEFPDHSFSFVLFSYNGIDYIDPVDRVRAMREIHRVLQPGGAFVLSSHNRRSIGDAVPGFTPPPVDPTGNPLRWMLRQLKARRVRARARANYERHASQQYVRPEIAWINDGGYESALLCCYITPAEQIRQLREAGFDDVDMILDTQGARCDEHTRDKFFYVRALKRA